MTAGTGLSILRPDWPAPVNAGFTTRHGGVSEPPYDALNLAMHVGDDPAAVRENRRRLVEQAGLPEAPRWLSQVHGTRVVHASAVERDVTEADAVWTDQPGQVCAVLVADCVPILLAARDGTCVAAVHAGWRGLAAGVIPQTLAALPVPASELMACIGPCIGAEAYAVGGEVIEAMASEGVAARYRSATVTDNAGEGPPADETPSGRFQLDLAATARGILADGGVGAITGVGRCTHTASSASYSYRRDGATGRLAGFVARLAKA
ncbi:peptidoglycan editing factor PgeF [Spiribacter roseus]|uniref:Purine nucleoside phosphorylase n=1 Tax=Spiribacter roseus TaxID=1855875 RepID=A0ABV3RXA1_9GAMM